MRAGLERYLDEFFGVRGALGAHRLWRRRESLWIAPFDAAPPPGQPLEAFGMLVSRRMPPRGQLSAWFVRRFCASASRRVIELDGARGVAFLSGDDVAGVFDDLPDGPRLVRVDGHLQGRGRLRGTTLSCELPKELRLRR